MVRTVTPMTTTRTFTGTATFDSWEEDPPFGPEAPTPRLAHATVRFAYAGGLEGSSECRSVLAYAVDPEAAYTGTMVGLERLATSVDGVPGEVTLRNLGTFGNHGVIIEWAVIDGSGTGACEGWSGSGGYTAGPDTKEWVWTLNVET